MNVVINQKNGQAVQAISSLDTHRFRDKKGVLFAEWRMIHPHQVIRAFLSQMRILDPALLKHTRSVTYYTLLMARKHNFTTQNERKLVYSSLLHDLGQMGIEQRILEKREKLTPQEWEIIRAHPINSVKILSPFPCFLDISPIIKHHHERFDGTDTPMASRARRALMISDALETIEENKGKQVDPKIAGLFIAVVVENLKRRTLRERPAQVANTNIR